MKLQPIYDNLIVKLQEDSGKTPSGLFVSSSNDSSKTATVVAVGEGRPLMDKGEYHSLPINTGSNVLIRWGSGANNYKFKFEGNEYFQIDPSQVIAIVKE